MERMTCQELQGTVKNCQELWRNGTHWQAWSHGVTYHIVWQQWRSGTDIQVLKQWNGCHAKNCQELSRELQRNPLERPKEGHGHVLESLAKPQIAQEIMWHHLAIDMTWCEKQKHAWWEMPSLTWHGMAWHDMTWHVVTCRVMTSHMTRHVMSRTAKNKLSKSKKSRANPCQAMPGSAKQCLGKAKERSCSCLGKVLQNQRSRKT